MYRAIVIAVLGTIAGCGHALAQLPPSAFQAYNAAAAGSITPSLYSLYAVPLSSLSPTQINVGFSEVGKKTADWNLLPSSALDATLRQTIEPVVIGPGGTLYQINGHHSFDSLGNSIYGASDPTVYVNVVANYSSDSASQFVTDLQNNGLIYPLNNGVVQTVTPTAGQPLAPIPTTLSGLTNDPYRGLEFKVLKNKGAAGVGNDKTALPFADFLWGNAFRNAVTANGTGLPYLTPGDANVAAAFTLNGSNQTSLPGIGTIAVNKLPGYILPTGGSISVTGTISNSTLATGALDGSNSGSVAASSASFHGINGYTIGSLTVQPQQPGFVMQLGADKGSTVTLAGTSNTYTGGTTLLAGTLIAAGDGSLGAAPTGGSIDSGNIVSSVQSSNGIVFNSLAEGNATLRFGTTTGGTFTTARNIAIGGEVANFDMNGNTVTLTGQIASSGIGEVQVAPLTVNDNTKTGTLILAPSSGSNSLFHGNLVVSNGTLQAASDAAMGATTGSSYQIGQIDLDGGTFKAGGNFSSVRSLFLTGSSTYDVNGYATSFSGTMTDIQRTLTVTNSSTSAGSVAFGSLEVGATSTLAVNKGSSSSVAVTLTNGITRDGNATLFLAPKSGALGTVEQVFSAGASTTVTNGIVAPWIIIDSGASAGSNPYSFATYNAGTGYGAASAGSTNITTSSATQMVVQGGNATLSANGQAYALTLQNGKTVTINSGKTLTLGDGSNPAGLIMNGSASISGGTLAFGGSEALIYSKSSNTISSVITGSNGLTLSGSGTLTLNAAATYSGATVIDSGNLTLGVANALANSSGVTLMNVKSSPSAAILTINQDNTLAALNSAGNNASVVLATGKKLTIGDTTNNYASTYLGGINDASATSGVAGAITKNGSGLLDISAGSSSAVALNANSTIAVNGGQLRLATNTIKNANAISLATGTELQVIQAGTGAFASAITGSGGLHLESGLMQLTSTGNTYSGGTTIEVGSTLLATTGTLTSATNQTITNAGGTLVLDQTTTGNFTAVMADGQAAGQGAILSGSLVKDDSTGGNGGNVTITKAQTYTGATTVEAGTLTLGATDAVKTSSGVALGRIGGGANATLAMGADNTVQSLNSVAGNTTAVQLNGHVLTVQQAAGTTSSFGGSITDSGAGNLNKTGTGTLALSGSASVGGSLTISAGTLSQTGGSLSVSGNVTNAGTMSINHASATYGGTFTNSGTYVSDPSTQTFGNLTVTSTGAIQAALGDLYRVGGNFMNASTQNLAWNTVGATLEFVTGGSSSHTLQLVGADIGDTGNGYQNNFAWGTLTIDAGNTLALDDGLAPGSNVALYVNDIIGALISGNVISNIAGNGFNIYYDPYDTANAYLGGLNYSLSGGGMLIADVPEPGSFALLISGLVGGGLIRRRRTRH